MFSCLGIICFFMLNDEIQQFIDGLLVLIVSNVYR